MKRAIFFLFFVFSLFSGHFLSAFDFKTIINTDEIFKYRLRIDYLPYQFSINAALKESDIDYVELSIKSPFLSLGRLYLKGLIREIVNPDGLTPSSSVLTEETNLIISDSMTPTSRYGIFFKSENLLPLYVWGYKTNSYGFSCGTGIDPIKIFKTKKFKATSAFFITLTKVIENEPDSWFDEDLIIPEQTLFSIFSEIRCLYGDIESKGRKYNLNKAENFSLYSTFLGGISLPEYTEFGYMLRGELLCGNKLFFLRGIFQYLAPHYLDACGELTTNNFIYGGSANINLEIGKTDIEFQASYCRWLEQVEVVPSINIPQKDQFDLDIDLSTKIIRIKIDQNYKFLTDQNGILSTDYNGDLDLKIDFDFIKITTGAGVSYERTTYKDELFYDWMCGIDCYYKIFKGGVSFSRKEDETKNLKINADFKMTNFKIITKFILEDLKSVYFEMGFEIQV